MIDKLEYNVEKRAEKAENLDFCKGIKLLKVKDAIASMLSIIGSNGIFEQYTVHNISHINEMLNIAEWLIPDRTKQKMTDAEWLMLTLSIYLHDLGMVVSRKEYEDREKNNKFLEFRQNIMETATEEYKEFIKDDKFLYQEFVRKYHATRIRNWLENSNQTLLGEAKEQCEILKELLTDVTPMFKNDLGMICESHHKDDLDNFNKYKVTSRYGNDDASVVNLNYIAIILRCTDLLHITKDRTPAIERKLLDVSNPTSILEWEKQKAVKAVKPQIKRDSDGNINEEIEKDTIEITAYFSGSDTAEAYFGLSSYLMYVKKELITCNKIAKLAKKSEGSQYDFPWKDIDDSNITTVGFEAKKLEFSIEQDNILKLLVGHTLYNDSSVVVRELAQNAIDAIKLQNLINSKKSKNADSGKVTIEWDSSERILGFYDNGTGMTISDIENYLLKVGASKYRQKQFQENYKEFNPISRFGIGILTCFMVANDVDIETNPNNSDEVNILCLRNVNGKYLLKKEKKEEANPYIKEHGTIIKLHVRSDVDMSELELNLRKWIVVSDIPISLIVDQEKITIGSISPKDALINFLKEENYKVDNKTIKVEEKTIGNVTVACALRYNKYISDWSFLRFLPSENKVPPVGTCVEGIRVEFTTPGYKNNTIMSLANITGSKYQTNVARTSLEYDSSNETLISIYDCYRKFIEDQITELEKQNYSKSWAVKESSYLMLPLLKDSLSNENVEPIDKDLLIESLSEIECLFIEENGKRNKISINSAHKLEKVDILDYKIINAIEDLFREFPTDITVSEMIKTVIGTGEIIGKNPLITNFDLNNTLHNEIINKKQVSVINVDTRARKIQLTLENNKNIWSVYKIHTEYSQLGRIQKLYLPINDFTIDGLNNEIGVKTIGGIYLDSDSSLCNYLKSVIKNFEEENSKESKMLIDTFLECVFDSNFLEYSYEEKDFDYLVRTFVQRKIRNRLNDEIISTMWDRIDVDEFKKVILVDNHILYSLDNWTRKNNF